jgi:hypothetical protein
MVENKLQHSLRWHDALHYASGWRLQRYYGISWRPTLEFLRVSMNLDEEKWDSQDLRARLVLLTEFSIRTRRCNDGDPPLELPREIRLAEDQMPSRDSPCEQGSTRKKIGAAIKAAP